MGMAGQPVAGIFGHEGDQIGVPVHRLDGAEAESRQGGLFEDGADQSGQRAGLGDVSVRDRGPSGPS